MCWGKAGWQLGGSWLHDRLCTCSSVFIPFQVQQGCAVLASAVERRELERDSSERKAQSFSGILLLAYETLPGKFT